MTNLHRVAVPLFVSSIVVLILSLAIQVFFYSYGSSITASISQFCATVILPAIHDFWPSFTTTAMASRRSIRSISKAVETKVHLI